VSTAAELTKRSTGVLRLGSGSAQGVEQLRNAQDGWDVAIGTARILVDAGEIAGTATTAAGAALRAAQVVRGLVGAAADSCTMAAITKRTKRLADGRMITEPSLPPNTVAEGGGVRVNHNYRSNDHGPAHMHVAGQGPDVRIGKNGHPLAGEPALAPAQQEVVDGAKAVIRRAGTRSAAGSGSKRSDRLVRGLLSD
jgi:hypothetical protein